MAFEAHLNIERLCTIAEIASAAGVGVATVHRVLKGQGAVGKATAARVLGALHALNAEKIARAANGAGRVAEPAGSA